LIMIYKRKDRVGIECWQREVMASRKGQIAGSVGNAARDGKIWKLKQDGRLSKLITMAKEGERGCLLD